MESHGDHVTMNIIVIPYKTTSAAVYSPLLAPRAAVESRGWGSATRSLDYDHSGTILRVEGGVALFPGRVGTRLRVGLHHWVTGL